MMRAASLEHAREVIRSALWPLRSLCDRRASAHQRPVLPRVLRTFLRDRAIQLAWGIFLATFVYAMVILRAVRGIGTNDNFVPRLAVTSSFALVELRLTSAESWQAEGV